MRKHKWLILALVVLLGTGLSFTPVGSGSADQPDFPLIYVDESVAPGGVGSLLDPYSDFSEINWTTGGDNSIFDYLAGTPSESPRVLHQRGEEWREQLTIGCSGTATYPIVIGAYGSGADPIINGADLVSTWTEVPATAYGARTMAGAVPDPYNWRMLIPIGTIGADGTEVRVQLEAPGGGGNVITAMYIGEQASSGDAWDMEAGTVTELTYSGGTGTTISAGTSLWTDWVAYDFDDSKDYFISFGQTVNGMQEITTGQQAYYKAAAQAEAGTADVTGFTSITTRYWIKDMEVRPADVWQATVTTEPIQVAFDDTLGSPRASIVACNSARNWYWVGNVLYVYSTVDPDTLSSPGVEAAIRDAGIDDGTNHEYLTINDIHIKYVNQAGIWCNGNAGTHDHLTLSGVTIDGGGAIAAFMLKNIDDVSVTDCVVVSSDGMALMLDGITNATITGGSFDGATGYTYSAGNGVDLLNACSDITLTGVSASNNDIFNFAIEGSSYNITLTSCISTASGNDGFSTHGTAHNVLFKYCYSTTSGQQISAVNTAYGDGFTFHEDNYNIDAHYCIAEGNYNTGFAPAEADAGGTIYNCIAYGNGGTHNGFAANRAGLYVNHEDAGSGRFFEIKNCIIFDNEPRQLVLSTWGKNNNDMNNNVYFHTGTASSSTDFGLIDGGIGIGTPISWDTYHATYEASSQYTNPLMTDPANDDFTLQKTSPCINAGTAVGLTKDYRGTLVPKGSAPDTGAYEYFKAIIMGMLRWQL